MGWLRGALATLAAAVAACGGGSGSTPPPAEPRAVTLARGLEHPWSLAFLPDGSMLVTERPGRLRRVTADGKVSAPIAGVPEVWAHGQGGLLDVVPDPDFATTRRIFLSYSEPDGELAGTAVASAVLDERAAALSDLRVILRQRPKVAGPNHFGSRLVPDGRGHLYVTLGERYRRDTAQQLDNLLGKVVRIRLDGSIPADNPYYGRTRVTNEIWSHGHRNPQGAALHPDSGELWVVEHGPQGGDEVNIARAGRNYGWPLVSHGCEYGAPPATCTPVGGARERAGLEQPLTYWVPSIAPSGMAFYRGDRFPEWNGSLFVGALNGRALWRLTLDGQRVRTREALFRDLGERIRDVRAGPDGWIYLLTDAADGRVVRIQR